MVGDLAGGQRACLCQVRGDWEFYCSIFSFPKWNTSANMCWMCDASANGPLSFSNCSADAPWRATRRTHESYIAAIRARGGAVPCLFEHAQGLRLESIMIDVLHTSDQGFASHVAGNIIQECIQARAFDPGNADANIAALNKKLDGWYKANRVTSTIKGKLSKERVKTSNGWPKLKAKAAGTRHLAPYVLHFGAATS